MKTKILILIVALISTYTMTAQQDNMETKLPYYEIPDPADTYTAATVTSRMIDGLGFRYYWATEGLRDEDLAYKPNEDARTTAETLNHIYGLSKIIVNATLKQPNTRAEEPEMAFAEKRKKTLENFETAADILRTSTDVSEFKIVFGPKEYPFWNLINGPIEDAVWHCGQVVSFRRSSGNPFNSKANVFTGKVKE